MVTRRHVLLVESVNTGEKRLRNLLQREGFEITTVEDALKAVRFLEQPRLECPVSLLVTDAQLSEVTGIELCLGLRFRGINTPVLLIAANRKQAGEINERYLGPVRAITKPFTEAQLLDCIRKSCRTKIMRSLQTSSVDREGNAIILRTYPDPILRKKASKIKLFDKTLRAVAMTMLSLMRKTGCAGLSAPQIGVSRRVIAVNTGQRREVLINPLIIGASGSETRREECLSLPGVSAEVVRRTTVEVRGLNLRGHERTFEAKGMIVRNLQHQIDHLNGVLICDQREEQRIL